MVVTSLLVLLPHKSHTGTASSSCGHGYSHASFSVLSPNDAAPKQVLALTQFSNLLLDYIIGLFKKKMERHVGAVCWDIGRRGRRTSGIYYAALPSRLAKAR